MTGLKIIVADDRDEFATRWSGAIQAAAPEGSEVIPLNQGELRDTCEELTNRRNSARSGGTPDSGGLKFDDADVGVVDYDLLESTIASGAQVAYLLRCYSGCKVILELNRYGENNFDLNFDSRAGDYSDLLLGAAQLGNGGLWREPWTGYRPWHWPLLSSTPAAHARRVQSVRDNLDKPILELLAFPNGVTDALPRDTIEFIMPLGQDDPKAIGRVTFKQFVDEAPGGKESKDILYDDEAYARVAAARIFAWLCRIVVPRQDILVDAPHLISRFPSLAKDASTVEGLNKTTKLSGGLDDLGVNVDAIERHRWQNRDWMSAPLWFWPQISRDEDILEISRPAERVESRYVFCEDISSFVPRNGARDFRCDLETPFRRRYVADPEFLSSTGILKGMDGQPEDPSRVDYTPGIALAY